jgi:hypothetical protein
MVQKTYYKTKEYCKVKFSFAADAAETIEILGLNSDWKNFHCTAKVRDGASRVGFLDMTRGEQQKGGRYYPAGLSPDFTIQIKYELRARDRG